MKTQEFVELERETVKFLVVLESAQRKLRSMGSALAADALDRLEYKVSIEVSETLREMQLLEARGA